MKNYMALIAGMMALLLSAGCISSNENKPTVTITGDNLVQENIFDKYTLQTEAPGHKLASYNVAWGDGTTCYTPSRPVNETTCLRHLWITEGTYNVVVTAIFDNNKSIAATTSMLVTCEP